MSVHVRDLIARAGTNGLDTILTAYIISPSHGKGLSSSNFSVLFLRASSMMHCCLGLKYRNFSRPVVSSTEFGQVTVKFRFFIDRHQPVISWPTQTCFTSATSSGGACSWTYVFSCTYSWTCCSCSGLQGRTCDKFSLLLQSSLAFSSTFLSFRLPICSLTVCLAYLLLAIRALRIVCGFLLGVSSFSLALVFLFGFQFFIAVLRLLGSALSPCVLFSASLVILCY